METLVKDTTAVAWLLLLSTVANHKTRKIPCCTAQHYGKLCMQIQCAPPVMRIHITCICHRNCLRCMCCKDSVKKDRDRENTDNKKKTKVFNCIRTLVHKLRIVMMSVIGP